MPFSPNEFLANAKLKDGFAKNNRFEVMLPIPTAVNNYIGNSTINNIIGSVNSAFSDLTSAVLGNLGENPNNTSANAAMSRYLALQCEAAELPGRTFQTADRKIYGPINKIPYASQFNDINFTFLCTNEFYERKLFDQWMECIHPSDTWNMRFPADNGTRYLSNIKIIQYDEFIKQIYAVELIDAFPVGVSPQPLSWGEEGFHRLSVSFAYTNYKSVYRGAYDLVAAANSIFGGSIANHLLTKVSNLFGNTIGGTIGRTFGRLLF